jgi:hypothetical protein
MAKSLPEKRGHGDFGGKWTHVTDPAQIKTILDSVNVPVTYNQLMVAYDLGHQAYYCIYAAEEQHGWFEKKPSEKPIEATPGAPVKLDANPNYVLVYDRGDIPMNFEP